MLHKCMYKWKGVVPGTGFEPATSGHLKLGDCSPDHESGAIARLGYPGIVFFSILKDNTELRFSGFVGFSLIEMAQNLFLFVYFWWFALFMKFLIGI